MADFNEDDLQKASKDIKAVAEAFLLNQSETSDFLAQIKKQLSLKGISLDALGN